MQRTAINGGCIFMRHKKIFFIIPLLLIMLLQELQKGDRLLFESGSGRQILNRKKRPVPHSLHRDTSQFC